MFNEFREHILKIKNKRNHSIKNSLGIRDAFKWCKKNNLFTVPLTEKDFYKIIRSINNAIADELIAGNDIKFPQRMGQLEIRKYSTYVKWEDDKIKTNRGVDWGATLKLWYEDEEAKNDKILIKVEDPEVYTLYYNRNTANFNNKSLYQFKPHRRVTLAVRNAGKQGLIDAFKIGV